MFHKRFTFETIANRTDDEIVRKEDLYKKENSFGFVTEINRQQQELLQISELNSGWEVFYWYREEELTRLESDKYGCYIDSDAMIARLESKNGEKLLGEHRQIPLSFKADVPKQGNYMVTVIIKAAEEMKDVLIFTGRRRLGFKGDIQAGSTLRCSMSVNVCDIIPRGQTSIYEDTSVDITVVADKPRFTQIEIEEIECPTIYIAGDSTVADQSGDYPYSPGTCYCGWGQMIPAYFNNRIAVSNHAHSGLTTKTFREEGHYSIVERYIKPGDYLFIQFGHNDQKCANLQAQDGYMENLIRYVEQCREKGAFPVLITPVARNTWFGDGTYNDLLEDHTNACKRVGAEFQVPVLDLHQVSMEFIRRIGLERSKSYYYPNDYTHGNDYGGYMTAGFVANEIKRVCGRIKQREYRFLAECVSEAFDLWALPEKIVFPVKPVIYETIENPDDGPRFLDGVDDLDIRLGCAEN